MGWLFDRVCSNAGKKLLQDEFSPISVWRHEYCMIAFVFMGGELVTAPAQKWGFSLKISLVNNTKSKLPSDVVTYANVNPSKIHSLHILEQWNLTR